MSKVALIPTLKAEPTSSKPVNVSEEKGGGDFGKAFQAATTEKSGNSGKKANGANKPKQTDNADPPAAEQQPPLSGEMQSLLNQSQGPEVSAPLQLAMAMAAAAAVDLMPMVDRTLLDQTALTSELTVPAAALDFQTDHTQSNPAVANPIRMAAVSGNPPAAAAPKLAIQSEMAVPLGETVPTTVTTTTLGLLNPELIKVATEATPKPVGESAPKAPDFAALLTATQNPASESAVPEVMPAITVATDSALKIAATSQSSLSGVTGWNGRWQNHTANRPGIVQPPLLQATQVTDENATAVVDFSALLSGRTEPTSDQKVLNLSVLQSKFALDEAPAKPWTDSAIPVHSVVPAGEHSLPTPTSQLSTATNPINREHLFSQIVEHAKLNLSNGQSQMELQLKPDNLGKIQLKISLENQLVTARFVAESDQVKQIIETNLNILKRSLHESGIQVDSMMVAVGQQNHSGAFQHSMNGQGSSSQQYFSGGRSNDGASGDADLPISTEPVRPAVDSMINLIA